ncbi:MAG: PQQ-binding-like beta-propeller repeat protein, partial [Thermomicrobiales bacterium]
APVSFPAAIDDGVLVVGNRGGKLFAFDASTGAERWTLEPDLASIVYDPNAVSDLSWSMPLIADGRVIVAFRPWHLSPPSPPIVAYALDLATGEIEWERTDLVSGGALLFLWDDSAIRVLVRDSAGGGMPSLLSFDPANGEEIGDPIALILSAGASQTAGVIAGDSFFLYVDSGASSSGRGRVNVYDLSSGELKWRVDLLRGTGQSDEYPDGRPPTVAGGRIYLTSAGAVFALRTADDVPVATPQERGAGSGVIVASSDLEASIHSTPSAEESAPGTAISTQSLVLWNPNLFGAPGEVAQESIRVAPASSLAESTDIAGWVARLPP